MYIVARITINLVFALALLGSGSRADAESETMVQPERLISSLRTAYLQPTSFEPSALRYPLRLNPADEFERLREQADAQPEALEQQLAVARAAEVVNAPEAPDLWRRCLDLAEARLKERHNDPALLSAQVEAMVGADIAVRVVPAARMLLEALPNDWRAHMLAGDAHLRRADFNWRVLLQKSRGMKLAGAPELVQLNGDLAACEKLYTRAVELAPTEAGPRAAIITLLVARPAMASLLPSGSISDDPKPDVHAIRRHMIDLVDRNPDKVAPLWHTTLFFATDSTREAPLSDTEQKVLDRALRSVRTEKDEEVFLAEARGLLLFTREDFDGARQAFENALAIEPHRSFAAEWLGALEAADNAPRTKVRERVEARIKLRPRSQDWIVLGLLQEADEPQAAMEAFRKAISLDLDNPNARYNLAVLLLRRNPDSVEARHHLQRVQELRSDDREGRFAYAATLLLDGLVQEARRMLEALDQIHDLDGDLRTRIATVLKELSAAEAPPAETLK